MTSENIINEWNFVQVKYPLTKIIPPTDALYLSYLIDQDNFFKHHKDYKNNWFFIKRKYIECMLNVKKSTQILIEKRLEDNGYIQIKREIKHIYFRINYDNIVHKVDIEGTDYEPYEGTDYEPYEGTDYEPSINKTILYNKTNKNIIIDNNINDFPKEKSKGLCALSESDYNSFIPLIKKWNKQTHLTTHKINTPFNGECSRTVKDSITYIKLVLNGDIHNKADNGLDIKKCYSMIDIEKSFKLLNESVKEGKVNKMSLKDFIMSNKKRFSWFIHFMENPPKKLNESKTTEDNTVKDALTAQYIKLTGLSTVKDRQGIESQLKRLQREYNAIEQNIGLVYNRWSTGYANHIQTFNLFCETHMEYLKTYGQISIGHLSCGNKDDKVRPVWQKFIDYVRANHGVNLYPKVKDVIRRKRAEWLSREAGFKPDDFDRGYLKEDWKLIDSGKYKL